MKFDVVHYYIGLHQLEIQMNSLLSHFHPTTITTRVKDAIWQRINIV